MASETYICVMNEHSHRGIFQAGEWIADLWSLSDKVLESLCLRSYGTLTGFTQLLPQVTAIMRQNDIFLPTFWFQKPGNSSFYPACTWQM